VTQLLLPLPADDAMQQGHVFSWEVPQHVS
jgi:hypothetical protein